MKAMTPSQRRGRRTIACWLFAAAVAFTVVTGSLVMFIVAMTFGAWFTMLAPLYPGPSAPPSTLACGCPLGTHGRGAHDRTTRRCGCPPGPHVAGVHHEPTLVPKHRNSYAGGAPLPQGAVPELPKAPAKLSPTFDPMSYLHPQDRAWLDGQLDLTRPLFPPPEK